MTDRRTYVYHLEIHYPSGAFNPGFRPKLWSPEQPGDIFRWPQEKHYLDRGRAKGRANRLTLWGCDVTIHRSDPVTWPDELPERDPRPSAEPRRDPGVDTIAEQYGIVPRPDLVRPDPATCHHSFVTACTKCGMTREEWLSRRGLPSITNT